MSTKRAKGIDKMLARVEANQKVSKKIRAKAREKERVKTGKIESEKIWIKALVVKAEISAILRTSVTILSSSLRVQDPSQDLYQGLNQIYLNKQGK